MIRDYDIDDIAFRYMSFDDAVKVCEKYGVSVQGANGQMRNINSIMYDILEVALGLINPHDLREISSAAECVFQASRINETYPIFRSDSDVSSDTSLDDFLKEFERYN